MSPGSGREAGAAALRVVGTALAVTAALVAFDQLGPSPMRAADGALARAIVAARAELQTKGPQASDAARALGTARLVAADPLCPQAAALPPAPQATTGAARCLRQGAGLQLVDTGGRVLSDRPLPDALSLIGPLAAVALVLLLRRAALGLLLAVLLGAVALHGPWGGVRHAATAVLWPTLTNESNLLIIAFTLTMLGMVHVGIASGGFAHLARRIAQSASGGPRGAARRSRVATVLLGLAIFFDDYANALVVGSCMRPLADRTGVSRAKLAFLVDATSAAVAGVALVSTWVGFEIGLLGEQAQHFAGVAGSPYAIFLAVLPYRFYCLFVVVLAFALAWSGRDYGPMVAHERAAAERSLADLAPEAEEGVARWWDAMSPVAVVLAAVIGLDLWYGRAAEGGLLARFMAGAEAEGLFVLALAGALGSLAAIGLVTARGLMSLWVAGRAWTSGVVKMLPVVVILVGAMSMRVVTEQAGTQDYLAAGLGDTAGQWMPLVSFLTAGLVAFLTGSSWATMGILLPIVVPLAAVAPGAEAGQFGWLLASAAAVLDGAIFGDHCSPISDTTVMSSVASGCPHDVHVITQLPYALTAMLVAAGAGYVGTALLSWPAWTAYLPGIALLTAVVYGLGRTGSPSPGGGA